MNEPSGLTNAEPIVTFVGVPSVGMDWATVLVASAGYDWNAPGDGIAAMAAVT